MTFSKQTGFTIVEMITVILILVILAITVVPKYLDASEQANDGVRDTLVRDFNSSVRNVRMKWIMDGSPSATSNNNGAQVSLNDDTTVTIDDNYGYPVGSNGRDRVNNLNLADCESVFNDLVEHNLTTARRGQVNNTTYVNFDIVVTRQNSTPDICHYTWSATIDSRPANSAPSEGVGFSYNPQEGTVTAFNFG
ncbi:MAG: hypothetical protein GJ680_02050 [Alteromonadaceae bacterium]|nr:hypothetical protein [Alteromonadaceae bacterium]